ncbi:hypothetical protein Tco_1232498 [Tanacetum coccineum]
MLFCEKFHNLEEVHPVLPGRGDTMHERPAGKIGLYTRFFDFAKFRLPLSTFLVDILRHFHINISQLSVIGVANNDHLFWVDDFACPALFPWHTAKYLTRDPAPVAADFNAPDYATLVAHPSPFRKFPEEFLCLVGLSHHYTLDEETYPRFLHKNGEEMDIFAFIHTSDPTIVKVVERERIEDEPLLLETTIGRIIPLLPVAPDRAESKKRKTVVVDVGESSHTPKRLREDHGTPSGVSVGGKSMSAVQRLLVGAVLNAKVRGGVIPTLPFVTSFVSATPEHSSHHSGANVAEAEVDSLVRSSILVMTAVTTVTSMVDPALVVKEKPSKPSLFSADSSSAGGADPNTGIFSDLTGNDFLVGGIRTVIDLDIDLQKT